MKKLKKEYENIVEEGLLAGILRQSQSGERKYIGLISTMLNREDFLSPINGRLFAAIKLWCTDEEADSLPSELHAMFRFCGDDAAAKAIVGLSCVPCPDNLNELVLLGLHIRDQSAYRENLRLEAEARGIWVDEECERGNIPPVEPDDDVEW